MKPVIQLAVFFIFFQMEIKVRAANNFLQHPDNCLKSEALCSLNIIKGAGEFVGKNYVLHATAGSVVTRVASNSWKFVKGALWVEQGSQIEVETVFAKIKASEGQYWILEKSDKLVFRNINADLDIILRDGQKLIVPPGFEVWVAGLNTHGVSEVGTVHPLDIKDHLVLWNALFKGDKKAFAAEVQELRDFWGDLATIGSSLYKKAALRELASLKSQEENKYRKKAEADQKRQQVRKIYHQKVFEQ